MARFTGCPSAYDMDIGRLDDPEAGKMSADGISDIARSEMGIVALRHSLVSMAKLTGNDGHWHALHRKQAAMGMPQDME